jgi:hypothetical protein
MGGDGGTSGVDKVALANEPECVDAVGDARTPWDVYYDAYWDARHLPRRRIPTHGTGSISDVQKVPLRNSLTTAATAAAATKDEL